MLKFFRKSFDIELDDALEYPSAETICNTISKKVKNIEFVSKEKPVSFKQGNVLYEVEISMARGGYMLICTEAK
ncbi:DUF4318 domain-containing protein [Clostridium septicum]|uniref:DUF4318 domain-containing protein n=1 Tax=Clostridium septicum TaxID=1504 RepID=UPI003217ABE1